MVESWPALGNPTLTPELQQRIVEGVLEEARGRSIDDLASQRDEMLLDLLASRSKHEA